MVGSIASGGLARITADAAALRQRMEALTRQAGDGRVGEFYGDLAPAAARSIDLKGEVARRGTYAAALDRTLGRTEVAQTTLTRLTAIAKEFSGEAIALNGTEATRLSAVASAARNALAEVASLLNERHAGEYLFGGSDSANPPIADPDAIATGGMAAGIIAAVQSLAPGTAATIAASTLALAQDDSAGVTPFSAFLSDPASGGSEARRSVPAGDGEAIAWGLFANRNAQATSRGETTGSWSRDLLRGLAMLAGLSPASAQQGSDFDALMGTIRGVFASATDALGEEAGALGQQEARMTDARGRHADMATALEKQVAAIEEVDLAATLTALQDTRTRLEASYRSIAVLGELSLARFLG
jgi:flagellin-like hook-associated protein FlgL